MSKDFENQLSNEKCCPHCGNKSEVLGFYTIVITTEEQVYDWDGTGQDCNTISIKENKTQRCCTCNKIVKMKINLD